MQVLCKECAGHLNISPSASIPTQATEYKMRCKGARRKGNITIACSAERRREAQTAATSSSVGRSIRAPIHTNNIGRNDIAIRIAKAPQLHLQNFAKGIPDEILICHKFFRDTAYTRHTFKSTIFHE